MAQDTVAVRCPDCGETRDITVRQKRRLISEGRTFQCSVCRTIPSPAKVEPRHRNYWLQSQSMEWICETAEMIWGDGSGGIRMIEQHEGREHAHHRDGL